MSPVTSEAELSPATNMVTSSVPTTAVEVYAFHTASLFAMQ